MKKLVVILFCSLLMAACTKPAQKHAEFEGVPITGTIFDFIEQYREVVPDYVEVADPELCGDFKAYFNVIDHHSNDTVEMMADLYRDTVYCIYYAVAEDSVFGITDSIGYKRYLETRE